MLTKVSIKHADESVDKTLKASQENAVESENYLEHYLQ